jgi:hypothetical protein
LLLRNACRSTQIIENTQRWHPQERQKAKAACALQSAPKWALLLLHLQWDVYGEQFCEIDADWRYAPFAAGDMWHWNNLSQKLKTFAVIKCYQGCKIKSKSKIKIFSKNEKLNQNFGSPKNEAWGVLMGHSFLKENKQWT